MYWLDSSIEKLEEQLKELKMSEIKPKYVTFEQAVKLKEKGFDVECSKGFLEDRTISISHYSGTCTNDDNDYPTKYSAPEQHQVVDWLLEKHGIWVYVRPVLDGDGEWIFKSYIKLMHDYKAKEYQTRELQEAYLAAFDYILNKLI